MRSLFVCVVSCAILTAADTKPPTIPGRLTVGAVTSTTVALSWRASSDFKGGSGIAGYDVFRNGSQIATTTALTYTATGLAPSTSYSFAVRARDNAGNVSSLTSPVTATTKPATCSATPATPTGLAVGSVSATTVNLLWNAVTPPAGCTVTYNVFRNGTAIASALTSTTYQASGLTPSSTYAFAVSASTTFGSSPLSNPIDATTTSGGGGTPGAFPTRVFAPYTDATLWPTPSLTGMANESGSKYFSLGFIVAGTGCQATWGTYYTMSQNFLASDIASLRALGGDVIASFGGAANSELALACTTVASLQAQYQSVIDTYNLTRIDFDIEGSALANTTANDRRNQAIAALQSAATTAGRALHVQYTLPVLPSGLTSSGISLIENAVSRGVNIGTVNVMAMNYGGERDPNQMGQHAVDAMNSTIAQLKSIYGAAKTDAQVRAMAGVTPMIGINDVAPEVFTLADANTLLNAAQQGGIGFLAMWSTSRDKQCPGSPVLSNTCSGVVQSPWAFTNIFKLITGN